MDYVPHTPDDQKKMLQKIGVNSVEELFSDIRDDLKLKDLLDLPESLTESELRKEVEDLVAKNKNLAMSFLGGGAYYHYVPSVVKHLVGRAEFYTAYTPYQSEISQGMLQAIYEYQTCIARLTGMEVVNASMYDGANAMGEAAVMACNIKRKRNKVLVSKLVHPDYRETVQTYAWANNIEYEEIEMEDGLTSLSDLKSKCTEEVAGVFVQSPNYLGQIEPLDKIGEIAKNNDSLFVVGFSEAMSLALLKAPAEYGADIVVGEGQSFGNPVSFGGPYLGVMATKLKYKRNIPGRLVGATYDENGKRGFVLTLSAREQHIRREKASSNICSNEALCALTALIYLASVGKNLTKLAQLNTDKAHYAAAKLNELPGYQVLYSGDFFNEFVLRCPDADKLLQTLKEQDIEGGLKLSSTYSSEGNDVLVCVTEVHSRQDIDQLVAKVKEVN